MPSTWNYTLQFTVIGFALVVAMLIALAVAEWLSTKLGPVNSSSAGSLPNGAAPEQRGAGED